MKKKYLRLFNKKNTFIWWTKLKTEKLLATAKQLIRKNSICCFKYQAIFLQSERAVRLQPRPQPPLPLFAFVHFLLTPPPPPCLLHDGRTF